MSNKLGTLTLRTSRKPQTEKVTINQWISANARLMTALLKRGDLSADTLPAYFEYMAQIWEYFDLYDREKILVYDHDVRERVHAGIQSWQSPYIHGVLCLKSEPISQQPFTGRKYSNTYTNKKPAPNPESKYTPIVRDNSGVNICRDFQTEHGCRRFKCKFSHVCIEESCKRNHPQYLHSAICKE
jgi:hypothetical protein